MRASLSRSQIDEALRKLKGWSYEGDALKATYTFKDFRAAFSFMQKVARVADELNHHPTWSNVYNKVNFALYTHDAGNKVSDMDVKMASRICELIPA